MAPEGIDDAWLSAVLDTDVRLIGTRRIGDGLVGMNLRLELAVPDTSDLPSSMVVKLPSPDPTSRATGMSLRNYEREVNFYRELASTVDIRVPRCFHAERDADSGDFALLLEDLAPAEQGDQIAGCDAGRAGVAVRELARLHGPRWTDPTLAEIEWLGRRTPEDAAQLGALWSMFLPGFLGGFSRWLTADGRALVERFGARIGDWVEGRHAALTITHGDYRLDNLMFESAHGGPPIAAVDWQTPGHGPGTGDLSYFLGAGPIPALRREIERELVGEYAVALGDYGVTIDEAELWHHYRRDAYAGIVMSVVASQIVGASERSVAMFGAMTERHVQHALDLDSESLL